jgi:hypothetical protein
LLLTHLMTRRGLFALAPFSRPHLRQPWGPGRPVGCTKAGIPRTTEFPPATSQIHSPRKCTSSSRRFSWISNFWLRTNHFRRTAYSESVWNTALAGRDMNGQPWAFVVPYLLGRGLHGRNPDQHLSDIEMKDPSAPVLIDSYDLSRLLPVRGGSISAFTRGPSFMNSP